MQAEFSMHPHQSLELINMRLHSTVSSSRRSKTSFQGVPEVVRGGRGTLLPKCRVCRPQCHEFYIHFHSACDIFTFPPLSRDDNIASTTSFADTAMLEVESTLSSLSLYCFLESCRAREIASQKRTSPSQVASDSS